MQEGQEVPVVEVEDPVVLAAEAADLVVLVA
jgi:hypothetical protein